MEWHLILMIVCTILYFFMKVYMYSTSITISYYKEPKTKMQSFKRWFNRIKYYVKNYFKWYGFKHFYGIIIAWLIYGGFFIW